MFNLVCQTIVIFQILDVTLCLNKYVIVKSLHSSVNLGFPDINIVRNNRVANLPSVRDLLLNLLLQADVLSAKKLAIRLTNVPIRVLQKALLLFLILHSNQNGGMMKEHCAKPKHAPMKKRGTFS